MDHALVQRLMAVIHPGTVGQMGMGGMDGHIPTPVWPSPVNAMTSSYHPGISPGGTPAPSQNWSASVNQVRDWRGAPQSMSPVPGWTGTPRG